MASKLSQQETPQILPLPSFSFLTYPSYGSIANQPHTNGGKSRNRMPTFLLDTAMEQRASTHDKSTLQLSFHKTDDICTVQTATPHRRYASRRVTYAARGALSAALPPQCSSTAARTGRVVLGSEVPVSNACARGYLRFGRPWVDTSGQVSAMRQTVAFRTVTPGPLAKTSMPCRVLLPATM